MWKDSMIEFFLFSQSMVFQCYQSDMSNLDYLLISMKAHEDTLFPTFYMSAEHIINFSKYSCGGRNTNACFVDYSFCIVCT